MSSLMSLLQELMQQNGQNNQSNQNNQTQINPENYTRRDYENLVDLIGHYQKTISEYQSNMSTYLLLLASLQRQLNNPIAPNPNSDITDSNPHHGEENTSIAPVSASTNINTNTRTDRNSTHNNPRSSRRARNRSYASVASSRNSLRPLMTRYQPLQNNRLSESISFSNPIGRETIQLFESLLRGNSWRNIDVCGNSLFGNVPVYSNYLFPPLSSSFGSGNGSGNGNRLNVPVLTENRGNTETSNPSVNLVDIIFEYDDQMQQTNTPEREASLQRMINNEGFRNHILRAAGIDNRSNIMRWIVAPHGLDSEEGRGLTNEEIRRCTDSLVFEEGMEGLLSTVCPITMEEFVVGDRLLQLHECRHAFRERELVEWFQRHNTCPVCRRVVVE